MSTAILAAHRARIEQRIDGWVNDLPDDPLYAPMAYLMRLPGKRVRPSAVLLAAELFGHDPDDVLDEALGIELFHNFTLMHDDIMDQAPLRRGMPTVHTKWNVNTAILSGDAMLVKAYQLMARDPEVLRLFSRYALGVCEGQQRDMDLERRADVHVDEYTEMIRLKTAVLLGCALQVGATLAKAPSAERMRIGAMGEHLGLAFQLRDDLLDAFGDPDKVGKQRGGDLRAGKRTFLLIRGLEKSDAAGRTELREELDKTPEARDVQRMLHVLDELGVETDAVTEVEHHHALALEALETIDVPDARKEPLRALAQALLDRVH
ncbi:MAG: polyprenyl synthetase family protein [Flavobacteriales bacterium]|nr:polyprenyl synthetase family protein [Flavobacteriales bacterium]